MPVTECPMKPTKAQPVNEGHVSASGVAQVLPAMTQRRQNLKAPQWRIEACSKPSFFVAYPAESRGPFCITVAEESAEGFHQQYCNSETTQRWVLHEARQVFRAFLSSSSGLCLSLVLNAPTHAETTANSRHLSWRRHEAQLRSVPSCPNCGKKTFSASRWQWYMTHGRRTSLHSSHAWA